MNDSEKFLQEAWVQFACAALGTAYVFNRAANICDIKVNTHIKMTEIMAQLAGELATAMTIELKKRMVEQAHADEI